MSERAWPYALGAIVLLGLALRLWGIHNPVLDHPGWRQGDTAAIARNFATLNFNPFFPQTDYNGPRDNYVELELQIVPYLAAIGYKIFGVHEVFGRLISIAFSLGTVAVAGFFARWLFGSVVAGYTAAFFFATYPGSVYYGRTFTPDTTMTFFLTAALFVATRYLMEEDERSWRGFAAAALLTMTAILAKPVAMIALVPIAATSIARFGWLGTLRRPQTYAFLAIAVAPYVAYDRYLQSHAEWLWASGITSKHVVPGLVSAFGSLHAFLHKVRLFRDALGMLATTMLGPVGFALAIVGFIVMPRSRANVMLWSWLIAVALYAFTVVTVERVDYYLYPAVPLAALATAGLATRLARNEALQNAVAEGTSRSIGAAALAVLALGLVWFNHREVAPYYHFDKGVYRAAIALNARLPKDAVIVMAHYDPSVLYYINRKGWEEDPYLWTPFDQESAIAKGARWFVVIERNRFKRNVELYAWMQRFPLVAMGERWPVYETDPAKMLPGAEARWQDFRRREKAGLLPESNLAPVPH